jgi:hypothetical protein
MNSRWGDLAVALELPGGRDRPARRGLRVRLGR